MVATGYQFGQCRASQMGESFLYDCEYLGSVERLVFTPVTERAFLSLTSAIKSFQCGVLTGTAGAGKCQTIADLATVGICFSVFITTFIVFVFSLPCVFVLCAIDKSFNAPKLLIGRWRRHLV